jgi:hypothetical protein
MANEDAESFIGALCVSWVFYRDAQKRNDRGDTSYHPQFLARVSGQNQDTFIMRMTSERFAAARKYTDSPSLGRCVNHVRAPRVQRTLKEQVHIIPFTPKDWEFEVLTKLVVVGQQPAVSGESKTRVAFLGPTLSTFDSPSGHHCAVIPKSKGEKYNNNKRAGNKRVASNDPRKRVKITASASMVQLDEDKEDLLVVPCSTS